jgi:fatty-acyl-CoA synthase
MSANSQWLEVFFAALRLRAVVVPFNLTWTADEIAQGIRLTETTVLLFAPEHRGEDLIARVVPLLDRPEAIPSLRTLAVTRGPSIAGRYESLDELAERPGDAVDDREPNGRCRPDDVALLLLTSGSTSFPKPAIHTHETILCGTASYADGLEAKAEDVLLHCTPNYHVGGMLTACLALMRGATLRVMPVFDPDEAMRLIETDRVTLFWGFDTHFLMMKTAPSYGTRDLSSISRTMVGANPATFDKIREMGFSHLGSLYGSTEYMGSQTYFPYRDRHDFERMRASNGRPTSGEIRIADPESGAWLAPEQMGEICVRGPALFKGYYKLPEATAQCIDADGFFHSGDLGYLDADGYLYFRGRIKEMVKSGGENVSALEVETFLMSEIQGVDRAMICGTPHEKWGEAVTAVLQVSPGTSWTAEDIVEQCRGRLAGYKIPKRVVFFGADDWKVTPTGKLDRKAATALACAKLGLPEA